MWVRYFAITMIVEKGLGKDENFYAVLMVLENDMTGVIGNLSGMI